MGTSTPAEFEAKCEKVAAEMKPAAVRSVERAARVLKRGYETDARGATGDQRLSGTSRATSKTTAGRRVGARYNLSSDADDPIAVVFATGPAHLIEYPTRRHLIVASGLGARSATRRVTRELGARAAFGGSGRGLFRGTQRQFIGSRRAIAEGRARSAKRALTIGGNLRAYAFHPGTRGKHIWRDAMQARAGSVIADMRGDPMRVVQRTFGGGGASGE